MPRTLLLTLVLGLTAAPLSAQRTAAAFLGVGVGARGEAMSGASAAVTTGVNALFWNPAGIAELEGPAASASYSQLYEGFDLAHFFAGAVVPTSALHLGASVVSFTSGEMTRTTDAEPEGVAGPDARFGWSGVALGLHAARALNGRITAGVSAKLVQDGYDGASVSFAAADLGLLVNGALAGTTLGASLRNVGTAARLGGSRYVLPASLHLSAATRLVGAGDALVGRSPQHGLTLLGDVAGARSGDVEPALGVEYGFRERVYARAGTRWASEGDLAAEARTSVGAGLVLPLGHARRLHLDYAFTHFGELRGVQVLTLELRFP